MMKKLMAALTSIAMVVALAFTTVSAATVTVNDKSTLANHTYVAYQILSANEATSQNNKLTDVAWGDGINHAAFVAGLDGILPGLDGTAADFVEKVSAASVDAKAVAKIALKHIKGEGTTITTTTTELPAGYYLIVDRTTDPTDKVYNAALLQVTTDITIGHKTGKPSVEKKVYENVKTIPESEYGNQYNDVADYNVGDDVPFKLIGTIPDMTYYDHYKYVFHDTLADGLTLDETSIKVYLSADKIVSGDDTNVTTSFKVAKDSQSFTVGTNDLKALDTTGKQYVLVIYTATLNDQAQVGLPGNENEVYLEYSNKPDQSGLGNTDENGNPQPSENNSTDVTEKDKVIVFTYAADYTKVDATTGLALEGAKFKFKKGNEFATLQEVTIDEITGYKVTGWDATGTEITTEADGKIVIVGLDDDEYTLVETAAPAGYSLPANPETTVSVKANTQNGQNWTDGIPGNALVVTDGLEWTVSPNDGKVTGKIENKEASALPETGGMGTYVIYGAGALLMAAGAAYFVNKKKA